MCRFPVQVTRIVRITVTGNVFFAVRAACELVVGWSLYKHYKSELLASEAVQDDCENDSGSRKG